MFDLTLLTNILNKYTPVSLQQTEKVQLMDRCDTKFIFKADMLPELLIELCDYYQILTIENYRIYPYTTIYYDTSDLLLYHQHQNGKLNRYKFRYRSYDAFQKKFIELKFKTNKQKTHKKRVEICDKNLLSVEALELLESETTLKYEDLVQTLENKFHRITLVNFEMTERLTLDFNLSFTNDNRVESIDSIVIAELKQEFNGNGDSHFSDIMKNRGIRIFGISKYCLGIILLNPGIKYNSFKEKLLHLKKIIAN